MKSGNLFSTTMIKTVIYSLLSLCLILVFVLDAKEQVNLVNYHKFGEDSHTQQSQLFLLTLTIFTFFVIGRKFNELKQSTIIICLFFAMCIIRELDHYLDTFRHDLWKPLVFILLVFFIRNLFVYRHQFRQASNQFFKTASSGYFIAGMIITFVYSRSYGRSDHWRDVMADGFMRSVKNASEESIESLGYLFILIGAIEFYFYLSRMNKRTTLSQEN